MTFVWPNSRFAPFRSPFDNIFPQWSAAFRPSDQPSRDSGVIERKALYAIASLFLADSRASWPGDTFVDPGWMYKFSRVTCSTNLSHPASRDMEGRGRCSGVMGEGSLDKWVEESFSPLTSSSEFKLGFTCCGKWNSQFLLGTWKFKSWNNKM